MVVQSPKRGGGQGALCLFLAALAWAPVAAGQPRGPQPHRMDGLAAVVGGTAPGPGVDIVLRSDVELRARMALSAGQPPDALIPLPEGLLAASLSEIIGELLIAREARRVQVGRPSMADLLRERRRLERAAGGRQRLSELLRAVGASEQELQRIAQRRALVAAFLSANLEGATVVTDGELRRTYQEQAAAFEGVEPAQALAAIRARLTRERLDRTIERWVSVLRARTETRRFADYGTL